MVGEVSSNTWASCAWVSFLSILACIIAFLSSVGTRSSAHTSPVTRYKHSSRKRYESYIKGSWCSTENSSQDRENGSKPKTGITAVLACYTAPLNKAPLSVNTKVWIAEHYTFLSCHSSNRNKAQATDSTL